MATRKAATTTRRRVRPREGVGTAAPTVTSRAEGKLGVVRDLMIKREALAVEIKNAEEALEKYMREHKLTTVTLPDIIGEIVTPMGRKVRVVRPAAFRRKVSDKDFMSCVTISITAAQEVLSGKELDSVCDVTPAEAKPSVLKIKSVKKPVKAKTTR